MSAVLLRCHCDQRQEDLPCQKCLRLVSMDFSVCNRMLYIGTSDNVEWRIADLRGLAHNWSGPRFLIRLHHQKETRIRAE